MKKTLSYLWPLTKKVASEFSGELEITWVNGKKVLDTKNANYSYGTLHGILDWALQNVQADPGGNTLVLGLGGGSVLQLLRKKYGFSGKITAVEIDPKIIEIAKEEFDVEQYQPLEIVCEDAERFVRRHTRKYQTVIIDLFIDITVPQLFFRLGFWERLSGLLYPGATVIFNAGIGSLHQQEITRLQQQIKTLIAFQKNAYVNGINTLLLGKKC